MDATIRRYKAEPGSGEEIAGRAREGFVPLNSTAPGFIAYYGVTTPDGDVVTVSVFEDRAGAEESVRLAAGWVRENLAPLLPNPPEVITGEVGWSATRTARYHVWRAAMYDECGGSVRGASLGSGAGPQRQRRPVRLERGAEAWQTPGT